MEADEAPEAVRRICEAMARRAVARCEELGIDPAEFARAFEEERRIPPFRGGPEGTAALFERTFRRFGQADDRPA